MLKRFIFDNKVTFGLEILELKEYGPLFKIGKIQQGSIILSINNKAPTWENLTRALNDSFPGDEINIKILDASNIMDFKIITEALPSQ